MGLRKKLIILISLVVVLTGTVICWYFIFWAGGSLEEQFQNRGSSMAQLLANNSGVGVYKANRDILNQLVQKTASDPDVKYVMIMDSTGKVLAHRSRNESEKQYEDGSIPGALQTKKTNFSLLLQSDEKILDFSFPITINQVISDPLLPGDDIPKIGKNIGVVRLGLSPYRIKNDIRKAFGIGILLTGIFLFIGIWAGTIFINPVLNAINQMEVASEKIYNGNFTALIDVTSRDEIGSLARNFKKMSENLTGTFNSVHGASSQITASSGIIHDFAKKISNGTRVQAEVSGEIHSSFNAIDDSAKEIAHNVETLSANCGETSSSILEMSASITEVANTTSQLSSTVEDTSSSITQMAGHIHEVADNVEVLSAASEETASAINEINATIREVENHAKDSAHLSEEVSLNARDLGVSSIEKTIKAMNRIQGTVVKSAEVINRLSDHSGQIDTVLTVINEVTRQTKLLALNAAIMAAQAGEEGKGFAIVADEIKNLSDRTVHSTKEISELIGNVQSEAKDAVQSIKMGAKSVEEGVALSLEAGDALKKIMDSSGRSRDMAKSIKRATIEQSKGVKQVTEAIQRVNTMLQQIVKATQEQTYNSEQIGVASEKMRDMTRHLKISSEEQAKGSREITKTFENVTGRLQHILKSVNAQKQGTETIVKSIKDIKRISSENTIFVEDMDSAVEILSQSSKNLKEHTDRFKI